MKCLVVLAALVAFANSAPSAIWGLAPAATGAVVQGPQAVLAGPSATIHANTGSIATAPAAAVVAAPAVTSAVIAGPAIAKTVVVGPSPAGIVAAGPAGLIAPGVWGGHGLLNSWNGIIYG